MSHSHGPAFDLAIKKKVNMGFLFVIAYYGGAITPPQSDQSVIGKIFPITRLPDCRLPNWKSVIGLPTACPTADYPGKHSVTRLPAWRGLTGPITRLPITRLKCIRQSGQSASKWAVGTLPTADCKSSPVGSRQSGKCAVFPDYRLGGGDCSALLCLIDYIGSFLFPD